MTKPVIYLVIGAAAACLALPAIVVSAIFTGSGPGCLTPAASQTPQQQWDSGQITIATTIAETAARRSVPHWGLVIALATAMQESGLRNLPHLGERNDHDSIGVFQQRPSQGWGTPEQLAKPEYQAERFFEKLVTIADWQQIPLTKAAQAVQKSAYPNAYQKWTGEALLLATQISHDSQAIPLGAGPCMSRCPPATDATPAPSTNTLTVQAPPQECTTIVRASTWLTAWNGGPVPYSANTDPATYFNGYRRDCSGFASMALGLPGPGLNTAGLAARSQPITKADLRPGDLLINPSLGGAGHVVIFDQWADSNMTAYLGYEQAGSGGTYHRRIPFPYYGNYVLAPYRHMS